MGNALTRVFIKALPYLKVLAGLVFMSALDVSTMACKDAKRGLERQRKSKRKRIT